MSRATVAIVRTSPQTVVKDVIRVCELAGLKDALDPATTTILKDNITWHNLYPGVNTTPWQLEGTIRALRSAGFTDLSAVHNHTVVTLPEKGEKDLKFTPQYAAFDIPVLFNFKPEDMNWVPFKPKFRTLALHKVFPEGIRIPDYFVGKNIVHLPTVKTHSYTTYTGALKNAFGGLLNVKRHYTHTWIHETLVDLLAIGREIHSGMFAIMDGTTAGSGPGPRTVIPHDKNILLASADQVAIDAVAATLMGFNWRDLPCIALSHEHGLGVGDPEQIRIAGDEESARENWHFDVGVNLATGVGRLLWHDTPLRHLQKLFFHTPLVNVFILASELYHDRIWYRFKGRKAVKRWLNDSPWGRLFDTYPG
ncbi:MAG: DUF362 domain-containing protein [Acidobacteriota bacterium]|jgi:uncharacterized protein (DUF362 family)|nr:DUF362 domain-containing protein [Acidobacteriota bacterium]